MSFTRSLLSVRTQQRQLTRAVVARPSSLRVATFSTSLRVLADPAANRRNSEGTMPGAGSVDEIADSDGAFDGSKPKPEDR